MDREQRSIRNRITHTLLRISTDLAHAKAIADETTAPAFNATKHEVEQAQKIVIDALLRLRAME